MGHDKVSIFFFFLLNFGHLSHVKFSKPEEKTRRKKGKGGKYEAQRELTFGSSKNRPPSGNLKERKESFTPGLASRRRTHDRKASITPKTSELRTSVPSTLAARMNVQNSFLRAGFSILIVPVPSSSITRCSGKEENHCNNIDQAG